MALELTDAEVYQHCINLAKEIKKSGNKYEAIYPIPMGGYPVAVYLSKLLEIPIISKEQLNLTLATSQNIADDILIVDDIIDSGKTLSRFPEKFARAVLVARKNTASQVQYVGTIYNDWITFPWEKDKEEIADIRDHIVRQLQYIGEDVNREGLRETPDRIVKSWEKLFGGYTQDPKKLLKTFDGETYDEMVVLKDIEFYSTCEHHFLPFFGKCSIAYIPDKKVIGVSKLARLMEIYSRRLQIQERIGDSITSFLMKNLGAKGAACIIEAQHFCMTSRGVEKQHSKMITSSLLGVFKEKAEARAELFSLINRV